MHSSAKTRVLLKHRRRAKRLRLNTTLRCPQNGYQASWCRGLCLPIDGRGVCGRDAPHALGPGRTQRAIAAQQERAARDAGAPPSEGSRDAR